MSHTSAPASAALDEILSLLGVSPSHPDVDAARRELLRLRRIEGAAIEFCERCRRGEVRSSRTYERFVEAMAPVFDAEPRTRAVDRVASISPTSTSQPVFGRS